MSVSGCGLLLSCECSAFCKWICRNWGLRQACRAMKCEWFYDCVKCLWCCCPAVEPHGAPRAFPATRACRVLPALPVTSLSRCAARRAE